MNYSTLHFLQIEGDYTVCRYMKHERRLMQSNLSLEVHHILFFRLSVKTVQLYAIHIVIETILEVKKYKGTSL